MTQDQQALKYAQDMVMDAFDDAVLNVPGTDKSERIVALVDELLPRLIDRAAEAGAINENHDLDSKQLAAFMQLLRKSIEETPGTTAALVVRIKSHGEVLVAGSSTGLRDEFLAELGIVVKSAVYAWSAQRAVANRCACHVCQAARGAKLNLSHFGGPKAQA